MSPIPNVVSIDPGSNVSRIRKEWRIIEDGALAHRIQDSEITSHYNGNRYRNSQIRSDIPCALLEQELEVSESCRLRDETRHQESIDALVAHQIAHNNLSHTPPLPHCDEDISFLQLRGGIKYHDEQYKKQFALPARVTHEPVYANNEKPEHYAVSEEFPHLSGTEALFLVPPPVPSPASIDGASYQPFPMGLAPQDIAISRQAERQLEMERRDEEVALKLHRQLTLEESQQCQSDMEYAQYLQAREVSKIRRAKERSRLKRLVQQEQLKTTGDASSSEPEYANILNLDNVEPEQQCEKTSSKIPHYVSSGPSTHREEIDNNADSVIVPPYMPMQQQTSKKFSILQKRIDKKKEKEGCKQQ